MYLQTTTIPKLLVTFIFQILVDDHNRAYGVVTRSKQGYRKFKARKEVILSAGNFESPKLLKLSGIGPAPELYKWGVSSKTLQIVK